MAENTFREKYNAFIGGLELQNIRLMSINAKLREPEFPGSMKVDVKMKTDFSFQDENRLVTDVNAIFSFRDVSSRRIHAKIDITLRVEYRYEVPPDQDMLDIFRDTSLMVNVWPYLRFWGQIITQGFGWPSFLLPLFKSLSWVEKGVSSEKEGDEPVK